MEMVKNGRNRQKIKLLKNRLKIKWKCSSNYAPHILKIWSTNINQNPSGTSFLGHSVQKKLWLIINGPYLQRLTIN